MKVKKAIIPAAGLGTRFLPATKAQPKEMLPVVDKPMIQYIVEEAIESGIEDIIIISGRGKRAIEDHFDKSYELEAVLALKGKFDKLTKVKQISNLANIHYIRQKEPLGLGHAILCAQSFVGDEPFAVLLGDDIMYNANGQPALKQLIDSYESVYAPVIGLNKVDFKNVDKYGIVDIDQSGDFNNKNLLKLKGLVEKPDPLKAPSNYAIMGRYILTPEIFNLLAHQEPGTGNEIQLTDALHNMNKSSNMYGLELEGERFDVGNLNGFIEATIELALKRDDLRDDVLDMLKNKINKYQ